MGRTKDYLTAHARTIENMVAGSEVSQKMHERTWLLAADGQWDKVLCQGQVKFKGVAADLRLLSCDLGSASASLRMPDMSSPK